MTDIVVVGSINVDLTSYLARWPGIGETVSASTTRIGLGGKGANQAVSAARLDASVTLIAATGADGFGEDVKRTLEKEGVILARRSHPTATTGMAFIDVGPDGGNIIRLAEGANRTLSSSDIARHADTIAAAKVLLLQNEIPVSASLTAAQIARENGVQVIMDPAPAPVPFWSRDTLEAFDIITPNAHETGQILGHAPETLSDAERAAHLLRSFGPRGAIVTMGEVGVAWSIDASTGQMPAPSVRAVDTVGAGDCFNGALATGLAAGMPVDDAIERAACAAALATTQHGAAEAMPRRPELDEFTIAVTPGIVASNGA